jgi:hypothetical protein
MKGFMFFAAVTLFTAISTSAQVPTNAVAVTVNPPANPTILQLPQPIAAGDSVVPSRSATTRMPPIQRSCHGPHGIRRRAWAK